MRDDNQVSVQSIRLDGGSIAVFFPGSGSEAFLTPPGARAWAAALERAANAAETLWPDRADPGG